MPPKEDDDIDLTEGLSAPGRPTNLEVTDFDATTVSLKWKEPENNGGAPIKEYFLEYRAVKTEEWCEGPKVKPKKFLTGVVEELTTNTKYEFRVSIFTLKSVFFFFFANTTKTNPAFLCRLFYTLPLKVTEFCIK